jgi:hypothetical protein
MSSPPTSSSSTNTTTTSTTTTTRLLLTVHADLQKHLHALITRNEQLTNTNLTTKEEIQHLQIIKLSTVQRMKEARLKSVGQMEMMEQLTGMEILEKKVLDLEKKRDDALFKEDEVTTNTAIKMISSECEHIKMKLKQSNEDETKQIMLLKHQIQLLQQQCCHQSTVLVGNSDDLFQQSIQHATSQTTNFQLQTQTLREDISQKQKFLVKNQEKFQQLSNEIQQQQHQLELLSNPNHSNMDIFEEPQHHYPYQQEEDVQIESAIRDAELAFQTRKRQRKIKTPDQKMDDNDKEDWLVYQKQQQQQRTTRKNGSKPNISKKPTNNKPPIVVTISSSNRPQTNTSSSNTTSAEITTPMIKKPTEIPKTHNNPTTATLPDGGLIFGFDVVSAFRGEI